MTSKHNDIDKEEEQLDDDISPVGGAKLGMVMQLLAEAGDRLAEARDVLEQVSGMSMPGPRAPLNPEEYHSGSGRVIEGVFDGQQMIGPDGKRYAVPANYASKSKLVEGDLLKLTVSDRGAFIYKQIGPISRRRLIGVLARGATGEFVATVGDKVYKLLTASVTYFRGHDGDQVVILIPETGESKWAAVENVLSGEDGPTEE